ncbi:MAG TPA: lyase family protein, partial [Pirellulaceae bacterium]|nr:lyase family protein [Pirellulaceae bacterium]
MASPSRSGVFEQATDRRVERFTESISFDQRLYRHDIQASIAHAQMLGTVGLLEAEEVRHIQMALEKIGERIEEGRFETKIELEDIHMHIETALIRRLDDIGRKLHTARSRNDQVATDLRLWVRDALDRVDGRLLDLQRAFLYRCDADEGVILP